MVFVFLGVRLALVAGIFLEPIEGDAVEIALIDRTELNEIYSARKTEGQLDARD